MPFTAQITVDIKPVEIDGKHFVSVKLDDHERQRGPFADAAAAQAAADKLIARWQRPPVPTPAPREIVVLHGKPVELDSSEGHRFVVDAVRAAEGLLTDKDLREKYEITAKNLKEMAKNTALIKAIRDERERRMRNGTAAKESASRHFVRAPNVMGAIMDDANANPRHRIEAAREIRATATGGADEKVPDTEKFVITFNLGADHIERYEKTISVKPSLPANQGIEPEQHLPITNESKPNAD